MKTSPSWPRALVLAAVALVALIGAGCSNGSAQSSDVGTVSSSGGGASSTASGSTTSTGETKTATDQDKGVKFAECIREHGVPHFPDPNAKGEYVFGIDVSPAQWQAATRACKALEPPGALSGKRSPKQQSAALRFAECVREHGVKDFPDPANGDPLIDTTKIPSSNKPGGMTILNAATHECGSVLHLAAGGQG
jgi:hypothetical protein